jgi:hypothetical protein
MTSMSRTVTRCHASGEIQPIWMTAPLIICHTTMRWTSESVPPEILMLSSLARTKQSSTSPPRPVSKPSLLYGHVPSIFTLRIVALREKDAMWNMGESMSVSPSTTLPTPALMFSSAHSNRGECQGKASPEMTPRPEKTTASDPRCQHVVLKPPETNAPGSRYLWVLRCIMFAWSSNEQWLPRLSRSAFYDQLWQNAVTCGRGVASQGTSSVVNRGQEVVSMVKSSQAWPKMQRCDQEWSSMVKSRHAGMGQEGRRARMRRLEAMRATAHVHMVYSALEIDLPAEVVHAASKVQDTWSALGGHERGVLWWIRKDEERRSDKVERVTDRRREKLQ